MSVLSRLRERGIELPEIAAPLASYVPAVRDGSYVYTSGQLPFVSGALPATGKVGNREGQISAEDAQEYARIATLNALAAAQSVVGSLDEIARVVKVTGFVASAPDFVGQPGVVNGASHLLGEIFGDNGVHARSAVGVAVLPMDSPVEIELILAVSA